jgi:enoyl-CoA hydratase
VSVSLENFDHILIERRGKAVWATLNRPELRNAINGALDADIMRLIWEFDLDSDSEVLVLTGAGKCFSGGGDIEYMRETLDPVKFQRGLKQGKKILSGILSCEKPIIARVQGDAIGLGATIALFCDIVIADEKARFADPHIVVGLTAGDGGAIIWPQLVGYARAKKYLLSGDRITGREAEEIGLIAHAVPAEALDAKVEEWVTKLTVNAASRAIKYTKTTINIGLQQMLTTLVDAGFAYEALSSRTADHKEAIEAFSAKRPPSFIGR